MLDHLPVTAERGVKKFQKLCNVQMSFMVGPNKVSEEDDYQIYEMDDPRSATFTKALYF